MILSDKKIKILNVGWVGQGDFGDEVMAYCLRQSLKEHGIGQIAYYHHGKYPAYQSQDDIKINRLHSFKTKGIIKNIKDNSLLKKYKDAPEKLETWEKKILADSLFKAMKAQDSRIHAIGKVRDDGREEEKLNRAFEDAA